MNEQQAKNLIKDTFEKPFEKSQFINFISNLLNLKQNEIINEHPYSGNYIPEAYRQYINSLYRIAKYEDDSEKKIDVLIVRLEKETSLERARSMQRNFIAWYLKGSRGGILKDAALVAFVSPDNDDWRFSFVKIQYLFKDNKAAEMLSSALRYSFLVGKNEISYTAQSQLIPFFLDDINKPSLEMLEQAFSVEKVSKKFFKEYEYLYMKALGEFNSNEVFTKVLEQNSNLSVDLFVRKLLGQIVFPYFLQKKGWLGIKIDKPGWKAGNRKFLRWTFEDCNKKDKNYFDRFLQPLFYAGFNKKEELFQYDEFQFKIPFLNGGLFEELFHWESTFINPANTLFSNKEIHKDGSIGTGILDIFDRYNFTIDENTAFEKEIAVDPEMLGKVFENLLPENLRKGKGTYYTPREIVAYMTKESLINYLTSKITPDDSDDKSKIEEKVRRLFDYKDLYINKKNKDKYGKEFEQQFYEMLDIVEDVNKHLQAIKIVDPACGSGAFPMGILLEIVSLREYIENEFLDNKISNYQLKKETIQNSIYGVDIDPGAVEIAKLRFWLSLVVDAEQPEPLPNLDYKIMQGNSLIESFEGIDLSRVMSDKYFEMTLVDSQMDLLGDNGKQQKFVFSDKRKETIINLKDKYYLETNPVKKKEIHQKIDKIVLEHIHYNLETEKDQLQLAMVELKNNVKNRIKRLHNFSQLKELLKTDKRAKQIREIKKEIFEIDKKFIKLKELEKSIERPYFLWHLFFSEIFEKENEGFDIVIANPPYISHDKIEFKKEFKKVFKSYEPFADIFCYFIELAINIQNKNGLLCYITSNSYLKAEYGKPIRGLLQKYNSIKQIINLEDFQLFQSAIVNTSIILAQSKDNEKNAKCLIVNKSYFREVNFVDFINSNKFFYKQNDFNIDSWTLVKKPILNIIEKMDRKGHSLDNLKTKIRLGIATGANYAFIVSEKQKQIFYKSNPENLNIIKPVIGGRDINRYAYNLSNKYIILSKNGVEVKNKYPDIYKYFNAFGKKFKTRGAKGKHWSNLRACSFFDDFKREKIIWIELTDTGRFALCKDELYLINSAYFLLPPSNLNSKYLLAILNSKIIQFYLSVIAGTSGMGTTRWINIYVSQFPIIIISNSHQQHFIKLVDQILIDKKAGKDTQKLEDKIDLMVYKLYELTYEEVKIVDPDFWMSKEEYKNYNIEG